MHLPHPIEIDLLEFIRTGKFDFIKLGKTKEWILSNFSDPDNLDLDTYRSPVWCYGNIEFHFHEEELFLIYSDYVNELSGGPHLTFRKWLFDNPKQLTLGKVAWQLATERIGFQLSYGILTNGCMSATITALASNVKLSFSLAQRFDESQAQYAARLRETDSNLYEMFAISLSKS